MSAISSITPKVSLLKDFGDHFSPMVVKELRHGLRTRFFTSALMLFHGFLILLLASALLGVEQQMINSAFWAIAVLSLMGVLPMRGFAALNSEAQDGTLDMLTLTSMSSFRIVFGKWFALFSQSLLVASSLLPYLIARYLFGGVEMATELAAIFLLVLASGLITAAVVAFSSQASIILRLFLAAAGLLAITPIGFFIISLVTQSMGDQVMREFGAIELWEQIGLVSGVLLLSVYGSYLFLSMGASRIAPPSENHSTTKRLVALGVIGLFTLIGYALSTRTSPEIALWTFFPSLFLTILLGMDVLTEEMPKFPTVVLPLVRRGERGRLLGKALLYPGWASGIMFYLVLCFMTYSVMIAMILQSNSSGFRESGWSVPICFMAANAVPVCIAINRKNRFANWWAIQWTLVAAGFLLAMAGNLVRDSGIGFLGSLTPITTFFGAMTTYRHGDEILILGSVVGGLWLLAAFAVGRMEMAAYNELEYEAMRLLNKDRPSTANDSLA